jgi:hypothetical protein
MSRSTSKAELPRTLFLFAVVSRPGRRRGRARLRSQVSGIPTGAVGRGESPAGGRRIHAAVIEGQSQHTPFLPALACVTAPASRRSDDSLVPRPASALEIPARSRHAHKRAPSCAPLRVVPVGGAPPPAGITSAARTPPVAALRAAVRVSAGHPDEVACIGWVRGPTFAPT